MPLSSVCVGKLRKTFPDRPISQLLISSSSVCLLHWYRYIKLSHSLSHPPLPMRNLSFSLSLLSTPSVCLWVCLSTSLPLSLFSSSSTASPAPSQIHLCLLSSLHVVAAIFSPYLEPDILSLLTILIRTPGRLLPEHACCPTSAPPTSNPQPLSFLRKSSF